MVVYPRLITVKLILKAFDVHVDLPVFVLVVVLERDSVLLLAIPARLLAVPPRGHLIVVVGPMGFEAAFYPPLALLVPGSFFNPLFGVNLREVQELFLMLVLIGIL